MIENSIDRFIEEVRQLQSRKGPYYDKWLKNYTKTVKEQCVKIADRYKQHYSLQGMESFLSQEQTRTNKRGRPIHRLEQSPSHIRAQGLSLPSFAQLSQHDPFVTAFLHPQK